MIPNDAAARAAATGVLPRSEGMPGDDLVRRLDRIIEVLPILEWNLRDGFPVGDHHPDADEPHSVRVTVAGGATGATLIALVDGAMHVEIGYSDRLSDPFGIPSKWTDPAREAGVLLTLAANSLRGGPARPGLDAARTWTIGAATACALSAGVDMQGMLVATMPSPFAEGDVDGAFFAQLPEGARRRAYATLEILRPHAPSMLGVLWNRARPEVARLQHLPVMEPPASGMVEGMRALDALRRMLPEGTVLDV